MYKFCPECSREIMPGWKCCPNCGFKFEDVGAASSEAANPGIALLDGAIGNLDDLAKDKQTEARLRTLIIREMYDEAKELCNSLIYNNPMDKAGYIGLIRIETKNYKVYEGAEIDKQIRIAEEIFGADELLYDSEYVNYISARKRHFEAERKRVEAERAEAERKRVEAEKAKVARKAEAVRLYNLEQYKQALPLCLEFAENGDADFQFKAGACFHGLGDMGNAVYWLQKSAEQGNAWGQCGLGYCYNYGQGVEKDYAKAVYWYQKAAEQGNADAQCNLGYCYEKGQGVEKDYAKAVYWYQKAVEQGHAGAQNNLGRCYEKGQGVEKNYEKAVYWYQKAAQQGHSWAKKRLEEIPIVRM